MVRRSSYSLFYRQEHCRQAEKKQFILKRITTTGHCAEIGGHKTYFRLHYCTDYIMIIDYCFVQYVTYKQRMKYECFIFIFNRENHRFCMR